MKDRFWFPAKRYGWGWGLPVCWQGWVVTGVYMALMIPGAFWFAPAKQPLAYGIFVTLATGALCVVCWLKGEELRWRWGEERDPPRQS